MKIKDQSCLSLFSRYTLGIAIIPNLVFAIVIYGCQSEQFSHFAMLGILMLIPMTLYYIPPAFISGGYGFVGQMGVGPDSVIGFFISVLFWSVISFLIIKLKLYLKNKKSEPVN